MKAKTLAQSDICFLGAGNMAVAMIRGLIAGGLVKGSQLYVLNRSGGEKIEKLGEQYGVRAGTIDRHQAEAVSGADVVVLAMKPKDAGEALFKLAPLLREGQLIVSVIAGLSISSLQNALGRRPVVRTMPNTSSTIGLGATGIAFSPEVSEAQRKLTLEMFEATGKTAVVLEEAIDAVNALSGSGPAYIYYMMEAMIAGGVEQGLTPRQALELTAQTVLGAATMVLKTGEDPAELRRKVTSPNGTTQAAIEVLAGREFQASVRQAMLRCAERAREMGAEIDARIESIGKSQWTESGGSK